MFLGLIKNCRKKKCPNCGTTKYINFSLEEYRANFLSTLENFDVCKYGRLLRCKKCNAFWFISEKNIIMDYISEDHIQLFNEWNNRNLIASNSILNKLKSIGATPPDIYGNLNNFVRVPCQCITKSGHKMDFCVVSFQKSPPNHFQLSEGKLLFIDEVADVQESEYALSMKVRTQTSLAEELRYGFSPTPVHTRDGKTFILNGVTNFFDGYGYKGKDISLLEDNIQFNETESIYYDNSIEKQITWIIADLIDQDVHKVIYDNIEYQAVVVCYNYWDYALYKINDIIIIDIVHDGIATYKSTFILNETEVEDFRNFGLNYIAQLVKKIQNDGGICKGRNISNKFKSDLLGV